MDKSLQDTLVTSTTLADYIRGYCLTGSVSPLAIFSTTDNDMDKSVTNGTQARTIVEEANWVKVLNGMHLFVNILGLVANVVAFAILSRSKRSFSPTILFLLQHQSCVDTLVCLIDILINMFPPMWNVGLDFIDHIVCHIWHSYLMYWWAVDVSIATLVMIAVDRYLAVCYPFKHQTFTPYYAKIGLAISYIICLLNLCPFGMQVSLVSGECQPQWLFSGRAAEDFHVFYTIYIWFVVYPLPCGMLAFFYVNVIWKFHQRKKNHGLGRSRVIDQATTDLTKTAISVTIILFLTMTYDINQYLFASFGIGDYNRNSPQQQLGYLFASINSCANPFIYALLMPAYRRQLVVMFLCCRHQNDGPANISGQASSSVNVTNQLSMCTSTTSMSTTV